MSIQKHIRRGIDYFVTLVTSNQCRGFSKPRLDFSYEGFEKPNSSGYEYPEARAKHIRRGIDYFVALVTSNQCRGFSKPRADFSYEGFEKPCVWI